jgi:hypothetical protein
MRAAYPKALTSAFVDSRTESIIKIIGEETNLRANRMFRFGGGRQHTGNTDNCRAPGRLCRAGHASP